MESDYEAMCRILEKVKKVPGACDAVVIERTCITIFSTVRDVNDVNTDINTHTIFTFDDDGSIKKFWSYRGEDY